MFIYIIYIYINKSFGNLSASRSGTFLEMVAQKVVSREMTLFISN